MSRVRSVFAITTLVAGALTLSLLPDIAHAQCSAADLCSAKECRQRHQIVDQACKRQKRSCTKVSANDKPKLALYLARNEQCLTARLDVAECFSVSDKGHDDAIEDVERAIDTCEAKLNQN